MGQRPEQYFGKEPLVVSKGALAVRLYERQDAAKRVHEIGTSLLIVRVLAQPDACLQEPNIATTSQQSSEAACYWRFSFVGELPYHPTELLTDPRRLANQQVKRAYDDKN